MITYTSRSESAILPSMNEVVSRQVFVATCRYLHSYIHIHVFDETRDEYYLQYNM